jgi:pilus assembly protein CpaB
MRRYTGVIVAVLLATIGTLTLAGYVSSARDDRATQRDPVTVLVVTQRITKGAVPAEIRGKVEARQIPAELKVGGALERLDGLDAGTVATADLFPGEQLTSSRLGPARDLGRIPRPTGLVEVSLLLDEQRALGGTARPGDRVGVVMSFEQFNTSTVASVAPGAQVPTAKTAVTHLTLHKVLVTEVRVSLQAKEKADEPKAGDEIATYPGDRVMVTLALNPLEAEQVVFASEFGRVWLVSQPGDAVETGTRVLTLDQVLTAGASSR